MPTDISSLKSIPLFSGLESEELEKISALMHPMHVKEGETLTRRNDAAHTFFVALRGNFLLTFKEDRSFTLHKRGDFMGWSTVVTPFHYRGTTIALTDGEVLTMAGQDFQELLRANAALSSKIMKKINDIMSERMPFITGSVKNP